VRLGNVNHFGSGQKHVPSVSCLSAGVHVTVSDSRCNAVISLFPVNVEY
jgi:hypothetical protein